MKPDSKTLWEGVAKVYADAYDRMPHYTFFDPMFSTKPTRWQRITYALWRKHWYRFTDWLRDKVCGGCS